MKRIFTFILVVLCFGLNGAFAQVLTGTVMDDAGSPLLGATVLVKGTNHGTVTDENGAFQLNVDQMPTTLIVSYTGYKQIEFEAKSPSVEITLMEGTPLDVVVVTGSRGKPRTVLGSPVAIDNINAEDLRQSGQSTVDQMLNYKVPSYNSSNQTISDATAHFDPSELRNLGPSRTLVLVNGKRKNQSALVYVNDTPGKGEVGTDMKSIPSEAIERVEVLRDGAAAQYGSDAIAGVINIVLKESTDGTITLNSGITTAGDGLTYDAGVNKGFKLGNGTLNLTGSYYHQDYTDRSGTPGNDLLFGTIFGDQSLLDGTHPWIKDNPDLGMTVGQPAYDKYAGMVNFKMPYGSSGEFYALAGVTKRNGKSFALYRAPYWITDDAGLLTPDGQTYQGFQPTFETSILDHTLSIGTKNNIMGWNSDLSITSGSNSVGYLIGNTINVSLLPNSPTSFDAGAYKFGNILGNWDLYKEFGKLSVSLGTEVRQETFDVKAGQEESYVGGGAQSFPGLQPSNEVNAKRNNLGVYAGADYDLSDNTLLGGAVRYENFSDFGSNVSWKVNARQFFMDKNAAVRASVSTGFRAPSLHQIYLSNVQTLVSGGTVSNQGTFNNVSDVIKGLGVPSLDAEKSFSIAAGLTYRIADNVSLAVDYYNIKVRNRVLFTGEIGFDGDDNSVNPVEKILIANNVTSIKYFVNALDTKTNGLDVVLDYQGDKLGAVLSANWNETVILNKDIASPGVVGEVGYEIFNRKEQSRVTLARPKIKALFGLSYKLGSLKATLNNTYFGAVTWQHATDPSKDQTFSPKVITDLLLGYSINSSLGLNLTVNNLLNVYPDVIDTKGDFVTDLGGRFKYPWEVNQFGFNGTVVKLGARYKF